MNPTFPPPDDEVPDDTVPKQSVPEQTDESPQITESLPPYQNTSDELDPLAGLDDRFPQLNGSDESDNANGTFAEPELPIPKEEPESTDSSLGWVVASSIATRASKRHSKRSEGAGLSKVIPPILGGLAAIPIAIAILWYGFGRDLGNAGPTIARYIPAIVPKHLRGGPFRDDGTFGEYDNDEPDDSNYPSSSAPYFPTGTASDLPSLSNSDSSPSPRESTRPKEEQPVEPNLIAEPEKSTPPENLSQATTPSPAIAQKETGTPAAKSTIKEAVLQCDEVQAKLKESWPSADSEKRQAMAREFYGHCLNLANQVASQKGISLLAWKRELDTWSRRFLDEPAFPRLLGLCLDGKIEGLPPHQSGDAILLIEDIGKPEPESTDRLLTTGLTVNGEKVKLLIPEAVHRTYLSQASEEPKQSLIIGVWQKNDSEAPWIKAVYAYW